MNDRASPPTIGLALGSGASRGWSHIGVVKALVEADVVPDVVCGTSVGAMVGAAYLTGKLDKLEEWVLGTTRADVLRFFDVKLSQSGFVDTARFSEFLKSCVAGDDAGSSRQIEELEKPYAAVATVLDSGRETWLTEGPLAEAVRASMAMPGLFPAVRIDGRWLVDGGLVNPVPVSVCRALGADVVIAVNLNAGIVGKHAAASSGSSETDDDSVIAAIRKQAKQYSNAILPNRDSRDEPPGLFYAVTNSINIFQDRITRSRLAGDPADVVLSPRVASIGMLEFHRAGEAIREGRRCVNERLEEIRRVSGRRSADETAR